MRALLALSAFLLAFPAHAVEVLSVETVEVPSQADHDALQGEVDANEQRLDALEGTLPDIRDRLEALEAGDPDDPPPPVDDPPTVTNLGASCDEEQLCSGNIGAADDSGSFTVTWGTTALTGFAGQADGSWVAAPVDGDGLALYSITGSVDDGENDPVDFTLQVTVNDTVTPPPPPSDLPSAVAGSNLQDCVDQLDAQAGGWCEMRVSDEHPSISSVYPTGLDPKIHQVVGPSAILIAWGGAAWNEAEGLLYFMGGGHSDYGGNEIYEFNVFTGTWTRLTDPSPADYLYVQSPGDRLCWAPDMRTLPPSSHAYDGLEFVQATGTIVFVSYGHANGACFADDGTYEGDPRVLWTDGSRGSGIYEFNPSREDERNGLAPLTWRLLHASVIGSPSIAYPRSYAMEGTDLAIGTRTRLYRFDMLTGTFGAVASGSADWGDGYSERVGDWLYTLFGKALQVNNLSTGVGEVINVPGPHAKALDVNNDGLLVMWNGRDKILTFDLATREWRLHDWLGSGPAVGDVGRVYGKWRYLASHDVFVGISNDQTGVWVYRHPASGGIVLSDLNPQTLLDQASDGDTVTIPPGTYITGLTVKKSMTLDLAGVNLWGVAGRKGVINVSCDGCTVIINDLSADGHQANCLGGNCAGVKIEGIDWHVTLNRPQITGTVMGILTDNRGGVLHIVDPNIQDLGIESGAGTLSHGIYAGHIDELRVTGGQVAGAWREGHLVKSRAPVTILSGTDLLGGESRHSRLVDIPCGGVVLIEDATIQQSDQTGNAEMMAHEPEAYNPLWCPAGAHPGASLTLRNVRLVSNRDRSSDERARTFGATTMTKWASSEVDPAVGIVLDNVTFENIAQLTFAQAGWDALPLPQD